jgi:voltage-gated potassium channel
MRFSPLRERARREAPTTLRLRLGLALAAAVMGGGVLGYHWIEGWTLFDSLYMTVITITTVGYFEVRPLSAAGRLFTMGLILGGVGTIFFAASALVEALLQRQVRLLTGRRTMQRDIDRLQRHTIVCGFGRMGHLVAEGLLKGHRDCVVVENAEAAAEDAARHGLLVIEGNATEVEVLAKAGLERAAALVAALGSDADNLFLTLTARGLRKDLEIVARANEADSVRKLQRAGASHVVLPDVVGADHIVRLISRPSVVDFVELVSGDGGLQLEVRHLEIAANSPFAGKTLAEARVRQETGCMVLAVRRPGQKTIFDPQPDTRLEAGDTLLAVGSCESPGAAPS